MTDRPLDDAAFERALRATLEDLAPPTAPDALRAAIATVPLRPHRSAGRFGRALYAVAGLAATVVLAAAGIGLVAGLRPPVGGLSPLGTPPSVSPTPGTVSFTFRVRTADGSLATKAQTDAVGAVMAARLQAWGIGTFTSSASDDRLTFELVLPPGTGRDDIGTLLGSTGAFSILRPLATPPQQLDRVTGPVLLARDAITDVRLGTNQTGDPTLDLTLTGAAAATFGDVTGTHIGEYLPIVVDGVAVSVPVIRSAIPEGQVQIEFPSDDHVSARRLVAILQSGPLPLPVEQVANPDDLVSP